MRASVSSRRRPARLAVILLATASLLVGLPGLAQAEEYVHRDQTRDVVKRVDSKVGETELRPRPARKDIDIRKVRVRYDEQGLRITVRTRGYFPTRDFELSGNVITPFVGYSYYRLSSDEDGTFTGLAKGKYPTECPGLEIASEADKAWVVIPGECIGTPPWVRVSVLTNRRSSATYDEGFRKTVKKDWRHKYSPTVRLD